MTKKMRAISKLKPEKGLWLTEANIPEIKSHDVLIKIKKTAICGTDLHIYNWDDWSQKNIKTPMIIGHEYVGVIEEVGQEVIAFKKGDVVSGEGHIVCRRCRNCLAGRRHLCANTIGVGVNRDGSFAEYLTIPSSNVWPADNKIDPDILSIFDPFGNAVHTALSFDLLGEDVLITGAGPIGIMAVAIAKHAGARHVVVTDINPYRLEIAKKMGASVALNSREGNLKDVMNQLNMKEGFDVGMEMSGSPQAFNEMLQCMFHGGKVAMLGILPPETQIDWNQIVFNGLVIKGIYGREMYETWYKMQSMLQSGLDISPVITHRFDMKDFEEAFQLMSSGKACKIILNWE